MEFKEEAAFIAKSTLHIQLRLDAKQRLQRHVLG